jgi:hypothetical protein
MAHLLHGHDHRPCHPCQSPSERFVKADGSCASLLLMSRTLGKWPSLSLGNKIPGLWRLMGLQVSRAFLLAMRYTFWIGFSHRLPLLVGYSPLP